MLLNYPMLLNINVKNVDIESLFYENINMKLS